MYVWVIKFDKTWLLIGKLFHVDFNAINFTKIVYIVKVI
jgi:hypothetical protein